ncbi:MAG: hypothetical protein O3A01_04925 [bacterium]|nr:hypothetical protein [bacterium]
MKFLIEMGSKLSAVGSTLRRIAPQQNVWSERAVRLANLVGNPNPNVREAERVLCCKRAHDTDLEIHEKQTVMSVALHYLLTCRDQRMEPIERAKFAEMMTVNCKESAISHVLNATDQRAEYDLRLTTLMFASNNAHLLATKLISHDEPPDLSLVEEMSEQTSVLQMLDMLPKMQFSLYSSTLPEDVKHVARQIMVSQLAVRATMVDSCSQTLGHGLAFYGSDSYQSCLNMLDDSENANKSYLSITAGPLSHESVRLYVRKTAMTAPHYKN